MFRSLRFKITDENFETVARMVTFTEAAAIANMSEAWLEEQLEYGFHAEHGPLSIDVENRIARRRQPIYFSE